MLNFNHGHPLGYTAGGQCASIVAEKQLGWGM